MARILGIDFGTQRTGLAVTDPLKIIVTPLATVKTTEVLDFLRNYVREEEIEYIVCGHPGHEHKDTLQALETFVQQLKDCFPDIPVVFQDEHLTSHRASGIITRSGLPKKRRREKGLIDKISAVLILQEYLGHLKDIAIP